MQNVGFFVLLLGVLVFVHELGHFLVAKTCGVKVLRFSIGFGPKLFGFRYGETEYQVALLPLGGYVKMAGDQPNEELSAEDARRGFLAQPPWKRAAIVAAGPLFNLIFPIAVYFFVFAGAHEALAPRVGSVEPGLPAAEAGLAPGDRIVSVDGEPVRTFEEVRTKLQPRFGQPIQLEVERDGRTFTTQLTPARSVETNPLESVSRGMIGISAAAKPPILGVPAGSPAAAAGFETFDRVLTLNGQPVPDEHALRSILASAAGELEVAVQRLEDVPAGAVSGNVPRVVTLRMQRQPGEGYAALGAEPSDGYVGSVLPGSPADKAGIRRGDKLLRIDGRELLSFLGLSVALAEREDRPFTLEWRSGGETQRAELRQEPLEVSDEWGQKSASLELGVRPRALLEAEMVAPERVTLHLSMGEALGQALRIVPEITGKTIKVLGYLVIGKVPASTLGGPIMLYQMAGKSGEQGWDSFLHLMAVISINLGVMNLLPIPILDGFHLLSAFWEGIRRRPIPVRAREIANGVGLVMLVLLMLVAVFNDITR